MKNLVIAIIFFLSVSSNVWSQHIFFEAGKTSSSFDFKNSLGVSLENLEATTQNYLGIGYKRPLFSENLLISLGIAHNSYGAIGSDPALNNFFEWDVDYLGLNLGLEFTLFKVEDFTFYIKANSALEFLIQGTQTINNQVFNLVGLEEFDNTAIFFRAGAGVTYPISQKASIYLQYLYGKSLALNDDSSSSQEELKINTNTIGIGIFINISSKSQETQFNKEELTD